VSKNKNLKTFLIIIISVAFVSVCVVLAIFLINNFKTKPDQVQNIQEPEILENVSTSPDEVTGEDADDLQDSEEDEVKQNDNREEKLGTDQERLLNMFGYPDTFIVLFDEGNNNKRFDSWAYLDIEACFLFEDGIYSKFSEYVPQASADGNYSLKPQQFYYGMSPSDVNTLMDESGIESIEELTDLKILTFGNGELICVFNPDDTLIIANKNIMTVE